MCRCLAFVLGYFADMAKAARSCEVLRLETRNLSTGHDVETPKLLDGPYARIFGILTWPDRPLPRPSAWRSICVRPKKAAGGLGELVWVACRPTGLFGGRESRILYTDHHCRIEEMPSIT